jgi:porin
VRVRLFLVELTLASVLVPTAAAAETILEAYYTGEILRNAKGGIEIGSAYLDDAGLTVESQLDALFGGASANLFAYFLWNNSNTFSDRYTGDLQVVSNIDAVRALRVFEFWYEQPLTDALSLRFGLYDLNSEFDAIDTASLFLNSSHGIGADFGQSGEAGPSIFPVTSLAARLDWAIGDSSTLRYALLDGVPGDRHDIGRTTIDLGGDDGVLHAMEYDYRGDGGLRLAVGGWLYSAEFEKIDPRDGRSRDDGNAGIYAFAEAPVYSSAESGRESFAFLRYGIANDELNVLDSYLGAGVTVTGLLPSRPADEFGVALASASVGDPYGRSNATAADAHETTIEVTYSARINKWLRLQPDIQYVINPGADPELGNALVLGLRFEITTTFPSISHERR